MGFYHHEDKRDFGIQNPFLIDFINIPKIIFLFSFSYNSLSPSFLSISPHLSPLQLLRSSDPQALPTHDPQERSNHPYHRSQENGIPYHICQCHLPHHNPTPFSISLCGCQYLCFCTRGCRCGCPSARFGFGCLWALICRCSCAGF